VVTSLRGSEIAHADPRAQLAAEYLRGTGVEIGAADAADRLESVEDESIDFVVANHVLERCEDPIGTIETHLSKLRPGGVVLYANSDKPDVLKLLIRCRGRFGSFDVEAFRRSAIEHIVVLRKHDTLVVPAPASVPPAGPLPPNLAPRTSEARIPLSALRARLDGGSRGAQWAADYGGITRRSLVQTSGSAIEFLLRLAAPVRFSAQAILVDRDWRESSGAVRPSVTILDQAGERHELWSASLLCAGDGGDLHSVRVECELPATTRSLQLGLEKLPSPHGTTVGRVLWLDTEIVDPAAPTWEHEPDPTTEPAVAPAIEATRDVPLVSVLTPVHNPPAAMLEEAIWSVRRQSFGDWELCLCDDGSTDPDVIATLQRHVEQDQRIQLVRRDHAGGISVATNAALDLARGEYIALLDHDDWLEPDALEAVATTVGADPSLDMLYSDEDVVDDGRLISVALKPDWSPETLCSVMYTCHVGVYRRELAVRLGGFRPEFDGAQDYDFVLRLIEATDRIGHVPQFLYHWRAHARSAAGSDEAKPFAYPAGRRAIAEHLERTGRTAKVQFGAPLGNFRVLQEVDPAMTVAIALALAPDGPPPEALTEAARSWTIQSHPTWEVSLAAPLATLQAYAHALRVGGVDDSRITAVAAGPVADPITALASACAATRAEQLILMQSPAAGLAHDWMTRLAGYCTDPAIGAAGAVVLATDGRIEHAGVAVSGGLPLFLAYGFDEIRWTPIALNVSAVTGVLATRRETFERLGGLRRELGELALVDYCLRAAGAGLRVVTIADARLRAIADRGPTNDLPAIWRLRQAWGATAALDPYYNPGYLQDGGDFMVRPSLFETVIARARPGRPPEIGRVAGSRH
jgi:GT2 family glycosyltransferase